jgi:hypothetical protein
VRSSFKRCPAIEIDWIVPASIPKLEAASPELTTSPSITIRPMEETHPLEVGVSSVVAKILSGRIYTSKYATRHPVPSYADFTDLCGVFVENIVRTACSTSPVMTRRSSFPPIPMKAFLVESPTRLPSMIIELAHRRLFEN